MKRNVQFGMDSSIVSTETANKIKSLIAGLLRDVSSLEADIAADNNKHPHTVSLTARILDPRRHNLLRTISSLEDRLVAIEHTGRSVQGRSNEP